ncbi:MAG: hypothetical protein K9J37_22555 [Saprospiraceae bacterium]|nr:hypothetical protein [Saprospiraceae bacterium]MCF8252706.1 hypothetical protein [Saprospiraceae bacterium]MCF8282930.1 hypothetical protein [Bacteroidales bacterium]MCF8311646.1 hypothetical protein [Saprospiraceae bacterium]MCF8440987.1 hypothetical protein [Saprospiraceae bacterium]
MNALELKGSIIDIIARVNDLTLLDELNRIVHEFIKQKQKDTDWWDELTPEQQEELQLAIDESDDEANLVSEEDANEMIQKWLSK